MSYFIIWNFSSDVDEHQKDNEVQLLLHSNDGDTLDPNQVEAPPSGVLPSLWYSRECVLHVWVIEKILGWKIRPIVCLHHLSKKNDDNHNPKLKDFGIDSAMATKLSTAVVTENIGDTRRRMECSRINPSHCPMVIRVASTREEARAKKEGVMPVFNAQISTSESE